VLLKNLCSGSCVRLIYTWIAIVRFDVFGDGALQGDMVAPRLGCRLIVYPTSRALPDIMLCIFRCGWLLLLASLNQRMLPGLVATELFLSSWFLADYWGASGFGRQSASTFGL